MSVAAGSDSLATTARAKSQAKGSALVNYWRLTLAVTLGILAAVVAFDYLENHVIGLKYPHRMWGESAEMTMRIIGFSHYFVAILFLLSSSRMQTRFGWLTFAGLALASILLSYLFAHFGGVQNPLLFLVLYFYFLAHDFRDNAYFYRTSPEAPVGDPQRHRRLLMCLQGMLLSLLVALLVPTAIALLRMRGKLPAETPGLEYFFPASVPFLKQFCICFLPVVGFNVVLAAWIVRTYPGGLRAIWRDHKPILHIFLGYAALVLGTLIIGPGAFILVTVAHFVGWYMFAERKLRAAPARPVANTFSWMRTTLAGFRTLHLGSAALFAALIAMAIYGFGSDSAPAQIFGESSFYYLTIAHITLSFVPR